jgi:hypothetical protein
MSAFPRIARVPYTSKVPDTVHTAAASRHAQTTSSPTVSTSTLPIAPAANDNPPKLAPTGTSTAILNQPTERGSIARSQQHGTYRIRAPPLIQFA